MNLRLVKTVLINDIKILYLTNIGTLFYNG